jgi:hypothetical protein
MHGKAAETQVLIGTDWIANISIRGVALFVSEAIDRHRKELHAILEILIHMWSRGPVSRSRTPFGLPVTERGHTLASRVGAQPSSFTAGELR